MQAVIEIEEAPLRQARTKVHPNSSGNNGGGRGRRVLGGVAGFCCGCVCSLIWLGIWNAITIAGIVIGAVYFNKENCPAQPHIALILIIYSALTLCTSVCEGRTRYQSGDEEIERRGFCCSITSIVGIVNIGLFIYLCVLVFPIYESTVYEPYMTTIGETSLYCHPTLFLFTFSILIITLALFGIVMLGICCCGCLGICAKIFS